MQHQTSLARLSTGNTESSADDEANMAAVHMADAAMYSSGIVVVVITAERVRASATDCASALKQRTTGFFLFQASSLQSILQ